MKKHDILFWMLVVSFVFGVALEWPIWSRFTTILLAGSVLIGIVQRLCRAYGKNM